jgi:hypothetical protein
MTNKLAQESSPYLLQHADNPVDWLPWGQYALELAQEADKPIFLSIGYAACHWCHVMAHESFEDHETANLMNQYFINIKVDREERPDIDSVYMDAVVALTGRGGWPLSVFLTPAGEPFFGGTYFPPERRRGMPAFKEVLQSIHESWLHERDKIDQAGRQLSAHLSQPNSLSGSGQMSAAALQTATEQLHKQYDWHWGGWGQAPKFPQPAAIEFLLLRSVRQKDPLARDMALHALRSMAKGGIYDQIGGGFARYSVDARWLVPHFEKMLYDNALLLHNYLDAFALTKGDEYLRVAEQILSFLQREMRVESAGYASSLDADSEGEEGKFYLWSFQEIADLLDGDGLTALFAAAYGVTEQGNFEGANILYRAKSNEELSQEFELDQDQVSDRLERARNQLYEARKSRIRPGLDDKVLTSWNGLLLASFARGAQVTGAAHWLHVAQELADFLSTAMFHQGRLKRSWRAGKLRIDGFLEDYAALGVGLLELYSADFNPRWYEQATSLAQAILERFADPSGGFYDTAAEAEPLVARPKTIQDSPIPSGNSLAIRLLQRLYALTGSIQYRQAADQALDALGRAPSQHPTAFATWLSEMAFALGPQKQLAIVGDPTQGDFNALSAVAQRQLLPDVVLAGGLPSTQSAPEVLAQRELLNDSATAYLCQNFTCQLPTNDPETLQRQLEMNLD